ncbi:MAG TPA: phospholipase D-like domain-containing protein [Bryobacteraceae bacterium]|jgi:phosphatidylserine/phosphatidylglycerophosphate/cardiolipin synthase-like enzyme|nr:phospholipase D-like domain-containing protein [Bryobacteraceae bacterium]
MATNVHLVSTGFANPQERVCFEPSGRRDTIVRVIRSARERLILSMFRCTDYRVLRELAAAVDRGVTVDALLTPRARGWRLKLEDLSALLESMGVRVRRYSRPGIKYHAKYIVADHTVALIASLNLTRKCFRDTCDFVFTTRDPGVVNGLHSLFEADSNPSGISFSECVSSRLVIGPERARAGIGAVLLEARRSIRIIDHRISDPWIVELLQSRRAAGVTVETLEHRALAGLLSHGKLILIDESAAIVGSMALSTPSLDLRRELSVVIRDAACIKKLSGLFCELSGKVWAATERAS